MMKTNKIIQGDALKLLKTFPDESINMLMTSPPYWALRDYGSNVESIWDGDCCERCHEPEHKCNCDSGFYGCEHDFDINKEIVRFSNNKWKQGNKIIKEKDLHEYKIRGDSFCSKCGAWKGQLGLEPTFDLYIKHLCDIFDEVKRVLRDDGTIWVNLGDTYGGSGNSSGHTDKTKNLGYTTNQMGASKGNKESTKGYEKSLCMIPQRFAIEMVNRGWILRNIIIWHKPNCMPSSAKDRFTVDFEYLFFFSKKKKYYFETQYESHKSNWRDQERMKISRDEGRIEYEGKWKGNKDAENYGSPRARTQRPNQKAFVAGNEIGRNKRAVWKISPTPFKEAHFAVYPEELCEIPIKAGCPKKGVVLDPFFGAGTTGLVALKQNKKFIGIELNPEYIEIAKKRLKPLLEQRKLS